MLLLVAFPRCSSVFSQSNVLNFRSRIAFTIQPASLTDNNLAKDERQALKRLRNDDDIVILSADKGRGTVIMDKTDYHDKTLATNRLTNYLNETRLQHFNENSAVNYFNLTKLTRSTSDITTG